LDFKNVWAFLRKRAVISFGKARAFFEAGVNSFVLDYFKKVKQRRQTE